MSSNRERGQQGGLPRPLPVIISMLVALALLSGCSGEATTRLALGNEIPNLVPVELAEGERLRVVATTNIVGDVVARIGGDRIDLTVLMAPGMDPHTYEPLPASVAAVSDAHVVFVNGLGLEEFLDELIENAGGDRPVVPLSAGVLALQSQAHAGEADPHVWFDVYNVMIWVDNIEAALVALDPANGEAYMTNTEAYRAELEALDKWIIEQVATVPETNRKLVTNHPTFGYFARQYGFEQVGAVYPVSPSAQPSAQDIALLEEAIRRYGVPAVFAESTVNPALAKQVARDTGVTLVPLYTDSLGLPGSGVESYVELMHYDVKAIVEALK